MPFLISGWEFNTPVLQQAISVFSLVLFIHDHLVLHPLINGMLGKMVRADNVLYADLPFFRRQEHNHFVLKK